MNKDLYFKLLSQPSYHCKDKVELWHRNTLHLYLLILISTRTDIYSSYVILLSGEPDYFGRNEISSGGDLSHYSSASLY